jgi:hypothetical protein
MRSTPARRELAFVLAVACAGLALVLVVVFAPWYPVASPASAEVAPVTDHSVRGEITRLLNGNEGGAALTP